MHDDGGPPTFELVNTALPLEGERMLGVWEQSPAPVSFASSPAGVIQGPVWRANLEADARSTDEKLAAAELQLRQADARLSAARRRWDDLMKRMERTPSSGISFDASGPAAKLPAAEANALAMLQQLHSPRGEVSFGLWDQLTGGWDEAKSQLGRMVDQLNDAVAHYAHVQTAVERRLIAETAVGWTGDVQTRLSSGIGPKSVALHFRTLQMAVDSRQRLLRMIVFCAGSAARLSALLSAPGMGITALPVAWRFLQQVLAETNKMD